VTTTGKSTFCSNTQRLTIQQFPFFQVNRFFAKESGQQFTTWSVHLHHRVSLQQQQSSLHVGRIEAADASSGAAVFLQL
jgi:hypothetical protein